MKNIRAVLVQWSIVNIFIFLIIIQNIYTERFTTGAMVAAAAVIINVMVSTWHIAKIGVGEGK